MTEPVASVSVSVTPDATAFWAKFTEQTRAGASAAGARAGRDFRDSFDQEVTRAAPRIRPDVDTAAADAQLARLRSNLQRGFNVNVQSSGLSASQLASVTAATNRLTDAQDALKRARAEQTAVAAKEGATAEELAAAAAKVTRAQRAEELSALRLAAAQETVAASQQRSSEAAERARAKLAAQVAANNAVTTSTKSSNDASFSLLRLIATLAPALVPVAGAAATAAAGFSALGIAGALAVKGIKSEMASGSQVGVAYAAQVAVAKNSLADLEKTAATNFLGGFQSSVGKLATQLPAFNVEVAKSSTALGQITSHVTGGLVAGFTTFAPVIDAAEASFVKLSAQFEHFATTANGAKFAQNLVSDFQQVVPLVENLAGAIVKLIVAAAPVGGALVSVFSDIADAINHIPTPALTAFVTALTALGAARLATGLLAKLPLALSTTAAGAEGAAASTSRLGTGLARLTPYVAAVIAANIGFRAADNATASWATSTNKLAFAVHQTAHGVSEIFSGNVTKGFSDLFGDGNAKAQNLRDNVLALQKALGGLVAPSAKAQASFEKAFGISGALGAKTVDANLQSTATPFVNGGNVSTRSVVGKGGVLTVGQQLDSARVKEYTKDIQALMTSQAAFYAQAAHSSSISSLSAAYTDQATKIQGVAAGQLKLIGQGTPLANTYRGVAIGSKTFNDELKKTGGNAALATGVIEGQIDAYLKNSAAARETAAQSQRLGQAVGAAAAKYKLSTDQVDLYTQVAGINTEAVARGTITQQQYTAAIGAVAAAVNNGSTSLTGLVSAIAAFNQAGDTAASRGALIGATLKAANGPLLDYANTMVSAATANQQLVTDFGNANKSILNLKKGTIDFHNAAAAPLLNDLANLQTAAVNSAAATYQYETSQGKASAASDAFRVYVNNTKGALEREFQQMGLTKTQADKLATSYFGIKNSGDLKKQIDLIGDDKVTNALQGILTDLDILSGKTTRVYVDYIQRNIGKAPVGQQGVAGGSHATANARGTMAAFGRKTIPPNTRFTVGEGASHTWEYGVTDSQGRASIYSNAQAKAMGVPAPTAFAGGTNPGETGGYTGVNYGGSGSKSSSGAKSSGSSSSSSSGAKKAAAELKSNLDSVRSALASFSAALHPAASSLVQAATSLLTAARAAKLTTAQANLFSRERARLSGLESRANSIADRLGTAPTAPTAYDKLATAKQAYSDTKSSVSSAITGGFNIGSAGVNAQVYNDQPAAAVSGASILADLTKKAANAAKFGAALKSLAAGGLPKALLLQLAQAGPDALPQALALQATSPKLIAQIGAQFNNLNSVGATAGTLLAQDLNGAGVAAAQGLIAGLKSQEAALKKQMQHLADTMVAQIKKDLGIHSPSRAFHELGAFTGEGFQRGIESKFDAVRRAGHGLAHAATPNVQAMALRNSVGALGGLAGHSGPLVEVHPAAGLDEAAVGNVAANRLLHAMATL